MPIKKKSTPKKPRIRSPRTSKLAPKYIGLSKEPVNFWTLQPTIQTVYWLLVGIAVIGTTIINFNMDLQVNSLIDRINTQNSINSVQPIVQKRPLPKAINPAH